MNFKELLVHGEMLNFNLLKNNKPVGMCSSVHRWTLISHFTRQRDGFKGERPEGWKRRKKEQQHLHEEKDASRAAHMQLSEGLEDRGSSAAQTYLIHSHHFMAGWRYLPVSRF